MSLKLMELREPRLEAREPRLEAREPRLLLDDTVRELADRLQGGGGPHGSAQHLRGEDVTSAFGTHLFSCECR